MRGRGGGDLGYLAAAALVSATLPLALAHHVDARLARGAAPALSRALGERVTIGAAEVELDGTLRLARVRVGRAFEADAVEAGVGPTNLLAGRFDADEIRVRGPRLRARVEADGSVDVARLLARAQGARRGAATAGGAKRAHAPRLRRILVEGGELVLELEGRGELRARGVELHPQEGGVRVIAAGLDARLTDGGWTLDASFQRAGVDVSLPTLHVDRAALGGGTLALAHGQDPALVLEGTALVREAAAGTTRLDARVSGGGPLTVALERDRAAGATTVAVSARDLPGAPLAAALPAGVDTTSARLSGELRARVAGPSVAVDGAIDATGVVVRHALVATEAVPVAGHVDVRASWDRAAREGHAELAVQTGALSARAEVEAALGEDGRPRAGRLYVEIPELACADALGAVPAPLRRPLDGLVLDGRVAAHAEIAFDRASAAPAVFDVAVDNRCVVTAEAAAADPSRLLAPPAASADYASIRALPHHVIDAFVAGEDARFFAHHGFDSEQLRRSFEVDVRAGRVERGGSTISQQLAKNLYLTRDRTLGRKLVEAVLTWRLEARVPKQRLFEVYLNLVELGEGVHGVEPAARRWFGVPAARLTLAEAAFLAALTPAPVSTDRRLRAAGKLDPGTRGRVEAILRSMRRNRLISDRQLAAAMRDLDHLPLRLGTTYTLSR